MLIAPLLAALLGLALLAAGCGGGDDSSSVATNASSATAGSGEEGGAEEGGGESSSPTGETPGPGRGAGPAGPNTKTSPVKARFVKQINKLCTERIEESLKGISDEVGKHEPIDVAGAKRVQAEAIHGVFLPFIQRLVDELEELDPPAGEEEQFEALTDAMQSGVDETMETEYTAKSVERFGPQEFGQANQLASENGLFSCVIA